MAGPSDIPLNPGAGPVVVATYQDSTTPVGLMHQKILLETQNGTSDPVLVNFSNGLPIQGQDGTLTIPAGNPLQVGGVYNTGAPTVANGQLCPFQIDVNGNVKVNIVAGAAAGGTSGSIGASAASVATPVSFSNGSTMQLGQVDGSGNLKVNLAVGGVPAGQDNATFSAGTTNGLPFFGVFNDGISGLTSGSEGAIRLTTDRKIYVAVGAAVSGGWTQSRTISAASTNATSLKTSGGQIGYISATNTGGSPAYLKIYNKASSPTVGTDATFAVYMLPAGFGNNPQLGGGFPCGTGIAFAITGGAADNDTTAVAAAQVIVNIGYL
jgi:hypothetical protein